MLDILDVINEATKEANSFENHAAKELTLEERVLYLQGLALVMNADGEIHAEEKEYIRILIKSFEMDESSLDSFVEFAQRPDKDTVQAFFRTFRRRPIAQLFLFDALMMTRRDDSVDEREKAVVDKIAEQLEVLKGTYQDIFDLFCHIKNKDWEESALYFSSYLLNPEHFKHLLDYFEVDYDELMNNSVKLRKRKIFRKLKNKEKISFKEFSFSKISYDLKRYDGYVSEERIKIKFPLQIVIPFIQSLIDKKRITIDNNALYFDNVELLSDYSSLGLIYNQESKGISIMEGYNEEDGVKLPESLLLELLQVDEKSSIPTIVNEIYMKTHGYHPLFDLVENETFYPMPISGMWWYKNVNNEIKARYYYDVKLDEYGLMLQNTINRQQYLTEDQLSKNYLGSKCVSLSQTTCVGDYGAYSISHPRVKNVPEEAYYVAVTLSDILDDGVILFSKENVNT